MNAEHAPQAPALGRMRRLLGPLYFNGVFWYRFHFWAAKTLPPWFLALMTRIFGFGFFLALHSVRRGLRANNQLIDPAASWWACTWRAYRTVHTFSWCVSERYQQFLPDTQRQVVVEGREHWDAARAGGQGVIVVTSHIGGWEIGSAIASDEEREIVVHVVREPEADPAAQAFVRGLVNDLGGERYQTHFVGSDPNLLMNLYEALRAGEVVALQGDRPRQGGRVERVEFFGETVSLPPGPAHLARLAEVPLLPVFTFREGRGSYRIQIGEAIQVGRTADRRRDVFVAVQALARVIESAIRSHPDQWFCFSDIRAYEGPESASKKVLSSPSATSSPEELETSKR